MKDIIISEQKYDIKIQKPSNTFVFRNDETWIIEINDKGINFNREVFQTPDEFAEAFIDILEKGFRLKIEEK